MTIPFYTKAAKEITERLRQIHPEDPIEYDFALAHLGISGDCQKTYKKKYCLIFF